MIRLKVIEFDIEIDQSCLLVPELYALLHSDKTDEKLQGKKCLMYVFYMAELNMVLNPYTEMSNADRGPYIRRIIFKDGLKPTPTQERLITDAIAAYHRCNINSLWATMRTQDEEIYNLNELLRAEKATAENATGRSKILMDIEKITQARERTRVMALQEESAARNRGNIILSALEDRAVQLDVSKLPRKRKVIKSNPIAD